MRQLYVVHIRGRGRAPTWGEAASRNGEISDKTKLISKKTAWSLEDEEPRAGVYAGSKAGPRDDRQ